MAKMSSSNWCRGRGENTREVVQPWWGQCGSSQMTLSLLGHHDKGLGLMPAGGSAQEQAPALVLGLDPASCSCCCTEVRHGQKLNLWGKTTYFPTIR